MTAGPRGGEGPVEAALDELYGVPPSDFVTRRAELAAAARTAGRAEDARRIRAARRPTLAAWAANLLLRARPEESRRFLELGRALREAYQELDAAGIRELSARRRGVVSTLSRQAARLASDTGHPLSEAGRREVEATLLAVLADEDAAEAWATGRLRAALTPPAAFPPATATPRGPARRAAPAPAPAPPEDDLAERRRQRLERLDEARRGAEEAERRLGERREDLTEAETSLRQTRDQHDEARQRVAEARERLERAREELRQAEGAQRDAQGAQRDAEKRCHTAASALSRAEQEARRATREVTRLTAHDGT
ncbi:hypothetical protein [Streptomyces sp. NPDC006739]|uniref:hypothetical protein n=1 Tax=Streptomyces sp. NPDC006739 TaxID=3364763 RepID=UPI003696AF2B